MSSCCDISETKIKSGTLVVALAGNPNSGKTTIFNALTGLRQKVANYPGVTVEKKTGRCSLPDGRTISVIDLPGPSSLISPSPPPPPPRPRPRHRRRRPLQPPTQPLPRLSVDRTRPPDGRRAQHDRHR